MKKNRILSMLSAAMLLMAGACSDDTLQSGKGRDHLSTDETGGVFMTVDFNMPNGLEGTRSETTGDDGQSNHGVEIGHESENFVTNALIVLASTEAKESKSESGTITLDKYGYIVAGEIRSNHIQNLSTENSNLFKAAAELNKANLTRFYEMYTTEVDGTPVTTIPNVYVFVFCNPTKELVDLFIDADEDGGIGFGSSKWIDQVCEVVQGDPDRPNKNIGIWGANSFLMNNKYLTTRKLPKRLIDWENYNSYENAFHLSEANPQKGQTEAVDNSGAGNGGPVTVERSVARFDYKAKTADNRYKVLFMTGKDGNPEEGKPVVGVELQKMCLVNMGNRFYYLPRVSNNGLMSGSDYTLCGREKAWTTNAVGIPSGGNYVVGPWAEYFKNAADMEVPAFFNQSIEPQIPDPSAKGFYKFVNYSFFDEAGTYDPTETANRWDVVKIEDMVQKGIDDKYEGKDANGNTVPADDQANRNYKIWRYVVENVIPGGVENQVNAISTGVVFKAKLVSALLNNGDGYEEEIWNKGNLKNLAACLDGEEFTYNGENHKVVGNSQDDPILYYFGGTLYMGWRHIRQAAIQASVTETVNGLEINRSTSLYRAVFGSGPIPPTITYGNGEDDKKNTVYIKADGKSVDLIDPEWPKKADGTTDEDSEAYALYKLSANYFWSMWARNGKEVGSDATGSNVPEDLAKMRKAVTDAGIVIYQSSDDKDYGAGYYCYYYYWNRHNDNYKDGTMGPMEFDVVRNNVYKLRVDNIMRLGHPRIPENDPNNPDPKTPDESDLIYLDVQIDIVPWVVRINGITFR